MTLKFKAAVSSVKIDREGEVRVTFTVPQSDRENAMSLGVLTEKVLVVEVKPEEVKE